MANDQKFLDDNYPKEQREQITELELADRGFEKTLDLSAFVNLQELNLAINYSLTGSLKYLFLSKLEKLTILNILSAKFDSGLEYLPASLEWLYCDKNKFGIKFETKYNNYTREHYSYFDYQAWRKDNPQLITNAQKIIELETFIINLNSIINDITNQRKRFGLRVFIDEKQSEINELEEKNKEYYQAKIEVLPKN